VYRIPCECGEVYVEQTGRSSEARCNEHLRHIRLEQPEKSAVSEHSINTGHHIFSRTSLLVKAAGYMDRLIKETVEIRLNTSTFSTRPLQFPEDEDGDGSRNVRFIDF
jgi:hypothetical protein